MENKLNLAPELNYDSLVALGWYYRADQSDGFSVYFTKGAPGWSDALNMYKQIEDCFAREMSAIYARESGYDDVTLLEFQKETSERLEYLIKEFHELNVSSADSLNVGNRVLKTLSAECIPRTIFQLCMQISYRHKWGLLQDDENNGLLAAVRLK